MRIACPSCAAEYEVPESRLKPGRSVRCQRCGNQWNPVPDAQEAEAAEEAPATPAEPVSPEAAAPAVPAVAITAMDRLAASPARPPSRLSLRVAWILTLVVLMAAGGAVAMWRDHVVRIWPPSGRILPTVRQDAQHPPINHPEADHQPEK